MNRTKKKPEKKSRHLGKIQLISWLDHNSHSAGWINPHELEDAVTGFSVGKVTFEDSDYVQICTNWNERPERIKIISKRFTVDYVEEGTGGLPDTDKGQCDSLRQKILVEEGLEYDTEKETVLHEVLHAVSDEMALDLSEEQVDGGARGILAVLMDNPSFARYLLKKGVK